ncbi:MAG: hypothetical protein PWP46_1483 [Fusobacteriaceae bacterium]|jgi:methyl-accepting chemotaxis protein|nr:hypothetical protein [Fusobacteriaceae bacterium]
MIDEQTMSVQDVTKAMESLTNSSTDIENISLNTHEISSKIGNILDNNLLEIKDTVELVQELEEKVKGFKTK